MASAGARQPCGTEAILFPRHPGGTPAGQVLVNAFNDAPAAESIHQQLK